MKISKKEHNIENTFKELFETNYSKMYYTALFLIGEEETAKDLVNDIFATLWETFNPKQKEYTQSYLIKSTKNRCLDYLRHAKVKDKYARLYFELYKNDISDEDKDNRMEIVYQVMENMPSRTRFIMDQCYFEGKKYAEVAEILGISKDGVRKHIIKALSMLRSAFSVNYKKGQIPKK